MNLHDTEREAALAEVRKAHAAVPYGQLRLMAVRSALADGGAGLAKAVACELYGLSVSQLQAALDVVETNAAVTKDDPSQADQNLLRWRSAADFRAAIDLLRKAAEDQPRDELGRFASAGGGGGSGGGQKSSLDTWHEAMVAREAKASGSVAPGTRWSGSEPLSQGHVVSLAGEEGPEDFDYEVLEARDDRGDMPRVLVRARGDRMATRKTERVPREHLRPVRPRGG